MFFDLKRPLIIFEMANNHMGDVNFGIEIIKAFKIIKDKYMDFFDFAFKLQLRDVSIIHPDYRERKDIKHIKRFTETKLLDEDFKKLKDAIKESGFISICTPFDEKSVDKMDEIGFDIYKIASCSLADWPLMERFAKVEKPIIISTGSGSLQDIDNVVYFFKHRKKDFCILHCVTAYPTKENDLQLNQIDFLKKRYGDIPVGFSTHENPELTESIMIAIAKGAMILEKHVGLKSEKYILNNYSAIPEQVDKWLSAGVRAIKMCGEKDKRIEPNLEAREGVRIYMRGAFANRDIKKGEKVKINDVFFAMPNFENQLMAKDFSKYSEFIAKEEIKEKSPIYWKQISYRNLREEVYKIVKEVVKLLKKNNIAVPNGVDCSISAHYGIEKFYEFGLVMINVLNREYCKKLLIIFPGQKHPAHFHKLKEETFNVLSGDFIVDLNGEIKKLKTGDILTIERGKLHSFTSETGAVVEEISTTHYKEDSYYEDKTITENPDRKIDFSLYLDIFEQEK